MRTITCGGISRTGRLRHGPVEVLLGVDGTEEATFGELVRVADVCAHIAKEWVLTQRFTRAGDGS